MPIDVRIGKKGALFLKKSCDECGATPACFGDSVSLLRAFQLREEGEKRARDHLGRWLCRSCAQKDSRWREVLSAKKDLG